MPAKRPFGHFPGRRDAFLEAERRYNHPVPLEVEKKSLSQKTWSHMDDVAPMGIIGCRNCTSANRTQFESPERGFAKHRVWLIISMPSFEGCHRSEALIGLGQTTRSTSGDDGCVNPLRECVLPGRCCGTWDLRLLRAASKPNPEYVRVLLRCSIPLP